MADFTFDFDTKNPYIDGKIVYSYTRNKNDYNLSYKVFLKRNNNYRGDATAGWLECSVYVNDSLIKKDTNNYTERYNLFEVPNATGNATSGVWKSVVTGEKTIPLGAYTSAIHSIGIKMLGYVSGLQTDYKSETYTVVPFSTKTDVSTVEITNNNNNTITVKTTTGESSTNIDGTSNNAINCRVCGTTDGSTPTYDNKQKTIDYYTGKDSGGSDTKTFTLHSTETNMENGFIKKVGKTTTIKLKPYTIATDNSYGNNNDGVVQTVDVYFYEPPKWTGTPELICIDDKPTPKSKYKVTWKNKVSKQNTTTIYQYMVKLYLKNQVEPCCVHEEIVTSTSWEFNGEDYSLKKGDEIFITVVAYDKYGNGVDLLSEEKESNSISIKPLGIVYAKISKNKWAECQVYVNTAEFGWREAIGVHSKVSNTGIGWKESI